MSPIRSSASGTRRSLALATGLSLVLGLSACSGSGNGNEAGEFGGDMYVTSCSLGCTDGEGGEQVFCSIINTFQNQEISVLFSEPIDLFTVNSSSFRVVNVANGTSPVGQFFLDPTSSKRLIFRPALTFDENGNPVFGFDPNTSYEITIPGESQGDDPPFIRSTEGRKNQSRLQCTIVTTEGVVDPVPGPPVVELFAAIHVPGGEFTHPCPLVPGTSDLSYQTVTRAPDPELADVSSLSDIVFRFDDIMNVATMVNPSSGTAPFIRVFFDTDGLVPTTDDRVQISGTYEFDVDLERLETYLCFSPSLPIPSAGGNAALPRRVVVVIPETVSDLVGQPTLPENGGGTLAFIPVVIAAMDVTLPDGPEDFTFSSPDPNSSEDGARSGAFWGGGLLQHGQGGGSGRLGDLVVGAGETLVLNTDSQDFPIGFDEINIIGNPDAMTGEFPTTITVTDGVFEFASVFIKSGGTVRLEGINPARVYCRGPLTIENGGFIDVSGITPEQHESTRPMPEQEALDAVPMGMTLDDVFPLAPNAGRGGFGSDRFDHSMNPQMLALTNTDPESNAIENVGADTRGRNGSGVARLVDEAEGRGGIQYPVDMPFAPFTENVSFPHGASSDIVFDPVFAELRCRSAMVGGVGSGGGYATDGAPGIPGSFIPTTEFPGPTAPNNSNNPSPTPGGDSSQIGLNAPNPTNAGYIRRVLRWQAGFLNGGSGGGGGGTHQYWTRASGYAPPTTTFPCISPQSIYRAWHDHSGASGGSGGGGIHITSGKRMQIDGVIDATGGNGGSARNSQVADDYGRFAMPGGGGSGGSVRLQGLVVALGSGAGRINVSGGDGGTTFIVDDTTTGGAGGTGLIRVEDANVGPEQISAAALAPSILPFEPADNSLGWLSVAPNGWANARERPGSMTASSSCWILPDGNFFAITLQEDAGTLPEEQAWNMDVLWQPGPTEIVVPYRGFPNPLSVNESFEDMFGNNIGHDLMMGESGAPIVVRFQGARLDGTIANLCDVDISDPVQPIVTGSVTPWVDHPSKLNLHPIKPNVVRYVIVFDGTTQGTTEPNPPGLTLLTAVNGITNLRIEATLE
ncbi:MAG: Ig-like domain-containing protein [bacterium]|nr:Ig-like domain-containing protein [bacterium]